MENEVWKPRNYIEPCRINEQVIAARGRSRKAESRIVIAGHVIAVLTDRFGSQKVMISKNTVTNDGDRHYAEHIDNSVNGGMTFTNTFDTAADGRMELGNASTPGAEGKTANRSVLSAAIAGSNKAMKTGYPLSDDQDGDNTGAGVDIITWLVEYATGDFNDTNVSQVILHDGGTTPGASQACLTYAQLTPFGKTATDTLDMFINHEMLGQ
jgi:hypothetical protein